MKKLALVLLAVVCCVGITCSAYADYLKCGDTVYVRSNLRPVGDTLFWHNMMAFPVCLPAGTQVQIISNPGSRIVFVTLDTKKKYRIVADPKQWDKYLVRDRNEIGINAVAGNKVSQIQNGEVSVGMTKQEVFASRGCPAYYAWGKKTEDLSLAEIMQSDTWYYMNNKHGNELMVTFQNGTVVKTGGFEH